MVLCDSIHEIGGERCIRRAGHSGVCWSKWDPVEFCPGKVQRVEWTIGGGFHHVRHYMRWIHDLPKPPTQWADGPGW